MVYIWIEDLVNSLELADVYLRRWTELSLNKVMAHRLFDIKPLSQPMSMYCQSYFKQHISSISKISITFSRARYVNQLSTISRETFRHFKKKTYRLKQFISFTVFNFGRLDTSRDTSETAFLCAKHERRMGLLSCPQRECLIANFITFNLIKTNEACPVIAYGMFCHEYYWIHLYFHFL